MTGSPADRHRIERIRQEPKRRTLTVTDIQTLGPKMLRIDFTSPDLADFQSFSSDDHIKVFLPDPQTAGGVCMRDYTPRRFDAARQTLTLDFVLHDAGPATAWARAARVGDTLTIGGPRGSTVVPDDFDWYLLVGDETALPSIGRRLEELRPGVPVSVMGVVDGPESVQSFETSSALTCAWVFRREAGADDAASLRAALDAWTPPAGDGYVWIAAEAKAARALRAYMLKVRSHPASWMKAAGYWVRGEAGASEKLEG